MSLTMRIENSRGRSYSYGEVSQMLTGAGFENVEKRPKIIILCHLLNIPTRYNASIDEWPISLLEDGSDCWPWVIAIILSITPHIPYVSL
jgi:hypothetical protein